MSDSVATIRALFHSYECKLNAILCQLEDSFASYAALQRTLSDDVSPIVNPISVIDKMGKMANAVAILKEEFEQLVTERAQLQTKFGQDASDFEERLKSTLDYLVANK